jgi:hypothetical protein
LEEGFVDLVCDVGRGGEVVLVDESYGEFEEVCGFGFVGWCFCFNAMLYSINIY